MIGPFKNEYNFLSNFYPCRINYDFILFPSVEHAYQASKTMDIDKKIKISNLPTAEEAKKRGIMQ